MHRNRSAHTAWKYTRWASARKRDILTCENNMLSSHVKRLPLRWLHNKSRLSQQKKYLSEMVWHFIGVYLIKNSRVENISRARAANEWNIFQHLKRNFVSPRGQEISLCIAMVAWCVNTFVNSSLIESPNKIRMEKLLLYKSWTDRKTTDTKKKVLRLDGKGNLGQKP